MSSKELTDLKELIQQLSHSVTDLQKKTPKDPSLP